MFDLLLASHISRLNAAQPSSKGENMEDAYFLAMTTNLPSFGRITRLALAVTLLAPLLLVAGYSLI